jgi:lipoate-protein ligase A
MILIDNTFSKKPDYNLALEEALLRQSDDENEYLLIYINDPSVIIGRHQNIYQEVNLKYCYERNIPVLRRISGGGAVYHDGGNLNFSFITKKTASRFNNYIPFLSPIVRALNEMGFAAEISERNDMLLHGKKISGSAQFTSGNRMITHGTLLFNADLGSARRSLNVRLRSNYRSKAKKSFISSIDNISKKAGDDVNKFKERLISLLEKYSVIQKRGVLARKILDRAQQLLNERYCRWSWNYGRSPVSLFENVYALPAGELRVRYKIKRGVFEEMSIVSDFISDEKLSIIAAQFNGQRNDISSIINIRKRIKDLKITDFEWIQLLSG